MYIHTYTYNYEFGDAFFIVQSPQCPGLGIGSQY